MKFSEVLTQGGSCSLWDHWYIPDTFLVNNNLLFLFDDYLAFTFHLIQRWFFCILLLISGLLSHLAWWQNFVLFKIFLRYFCIFWGQYHFVCSFNRLNNLRFPRLSITRSMSFWRYHFLNFCCYLTNLLLNINYFLFFLLSW